MMSRFKLTLVLIALNVVVYGAITYINYRGKRAPSQEQTSVLGLNTKDIDAIEIETRGSGEKIVLVRKSDQWLITEPIVWKANLFAVQRIISQLQFLTPEVAFSSQEVEASGQTIGDYGLDDPAITLRVYGDGESETLIIGKSTNIGNRVYMMREGEDDVLVIKESLISSITASLDELRMQQIFSIPLFELNRLSVQLIHPYNLKIRLLRKSNEWFFEAPLQTSANDALVNNAISQLSAINAQSFVLEGEGPDEIESPTMRVTIEGDRKKQTLVIGGVVRPGDKSGQMLYYGQLEGNPTIFTISAAPFLALRNAQEALRDKHFLKFSAEDVTGITIGQAPAEVKLQKLENDHWQIVSRDGQGRLRNQSADQGLMARLIDVLRNLEAVSFVSDAPSTTDLEVFGLNDPQRVLEISGEKAQTLLIGNLDRQTGYLYAKTTDSPYVYQVHPEVLAFVPVSQLHYKDKMLETLPERAQITSLRLIDVMKEEALLDISVDGESDWEKALKGVGASKRKAALGILSKLKHFKVNNYLKPEFGQNVQLDEKTKLDWRIRLQASVTLPGGESTQMNAIDIYFTRRLSGTLQIGGSEAHNIIFSLNQSLIDDLFVFNDDLEGSMRK